MHLYFLGSRGAGVLMLAGHGLLFAGTGPAIPLPAATKEAIDQFVRLQMEAQRIPGLSLAVVKDGQMIYTRGYGLANVEHDVAAKPETIYQSGSVGKQFTATAVMQLVEEGKVGLDDPISKYFNPIPAAWHGITVRHLLTHTSGIKDYDLPLWHEYTDGDLLRAFAEPPLDFPPGAEWRYSNTGYVLLGFLIEKVTGRFYGDFLHDRVFEPLGMSATRIISEADIVPNRAAGYRLVNGSLRNQEWVAPSLNRTADGALYFNVLDVAKWDAALYTEKVLKRSSLQQMWTPARLNSGLVAEDGDGAYGFGWVMADQRGHGLIEHGGEWQGFRTHIARYVDDRLTMIVLCNSAAGLPGRIAHGVAGLVEPMLLPPASMMPAPDPDPERARRLREFAMAADSREAKRLKEEAALVFLACDDVRGRGIERAGKTVGSTCYYRLAGTDGIVSYKFWLTAGGLPISVYSEKQ
jgi:CubicO group peptidase (beta-lactamase class C family)